jgi:hypothetical protein
MNVSASRREARERVVRHALSVAAWERSLADNPKAAGALLKAESALELACRDLTNSVDDSPPRDRPDGWDRVPGDGPG